MASITFDEGVNMIKQYERSVNKERFCDFLVTLWGKYPFKPLAIYMDNLSAHHSKVVKAKLEWLKIRPIFAGAYFSDGKENVFAIVKHEYKRNKLRMIANGIKFDVKSEIENAFKKPTLE